MTEALDTGPLNDRQPVHPNSAVPTGRTWSVAAILFGAILTAAIFGIVGVSIEPQPASALPSFARQTGQPCATCHTAFPELTAYGRRFKLMGYTVGGGDSKLPPLAVMLQPTFTHTAKGYNSAFEGGPPGPGLSNNDNLVLEQASVFYGGQIYGNLGAFVQTTYDGVANTVNLDNTDIRYADTTKLFEQDAIWGITVNNNPTVQDVWNTTPAWGLPYISSSIAPEFSPPGTMIEGGFAAQVAGAGGYVFWNDMLYVELSGYQTLSAQALKDLGEDVGNGISGVAPYWRVALERAWGENDLMVGTFGMAADVLPNRITGFGADHYLDVGVDAQYQYSGDMNSFTVMISNIWEQQRLDASFNPALGFSSNPTDRLRSFKVSGDWVYDHTYSLTAEFFDVSGSADPGLYAANATGGPMFNGRPDGRGLMFDAAYLPFSHGGPSFWPWANAQIGVSYTTYLKLYGGTTNFDGNGHNAHDNDTLLAYAWIMF